MTSKIEMKHRERLARTPSGLGVTSDSDSSAESSAPIELPLRSKVSLDYINEEDAEKLSYAEYAWKFLCLNPIFIEESDKARDGSKQEKADVAANFFIKRFKHHSESFHTGTTPRFNSSSISFWSNIDIKTHGERRSVSRELREGEVFVLFNLREASEISEKSLDIQLRRAGNRLRRLLEKYRETENSKKEESQRLTLSPLYGKTSLAKHYNLYLSTQFHPNLDNTYAYEKYFPSDEKENKSHPNWDEILVKRSTLAIKNARLLVFEDYRKLALFYRETKEKVNS